MRIAFYAPMKPPDHPVPSGDRRMARLFVAALEAGGHSVRLASRFRTWDGGTQPGRPQRLRAVGERLAARLIARYRRQGDPPEAWFTYHLYHKAPDWLGPAVARALSIPYIAAEASYAPRRATGPWAEGLASSAAAIAAADCVVAMSRRDEDGLRPLVSDAERLIRIGPFLDVRPFVAVRGRAEPARRAARLRWCGPAGEDGRHPWLLAVGMMRSGDKSRSYEVLAKALARLGDRRFGLLVAGDGPEAARIAALFPAERTRFLGLVAEEEMPELYAAADLLVWPAINEAYGMALVEAQAAGLPVVAGDSGGVAEVVRHGRTGLVVPEGDVAAFAAAVADLLDRPDARAAMGHAAAAWADTLSLDRAAIRMDQAIRAAASRRAAM